MGYAQVACYLLCGKQARQLDGYKLIEGSAGASMNILVDCPECGEYVITDRAQQFYFSPKGGKVVLDETDKKKLSDYVKKHHRRSEHPVLLCAEVVMMVTGKESVNIRYS